MPCQTCALRCAVLSCQKHSKYLWYHCDTLSQERRKEDDQFSTLADTPFGNPAMVASNFEGLVGYTPLHSEGQVPLMTVFWQRFQGFHLYLQHMACPCHISMNRVYLLCDTYIQVALLTSATVGVASLAPRKCVPISKWPCVLTPIHWCQYSPQLRTLLPPRQAIGSRKHHTCAKDTNSLAALFPRPFKSGNNSKSTIYWLWSCACATFVPGNNDW